jgi:hypothetical protein
MSVPAEVTPVAPAGEQKEPGWTTCPLPPVDDEPPPLVDDPAEEPLPLPPVVSVSRSSVWSR